MEEPRPTCPECGSVIDPRRFVTVSDYDVLLSELEDADTSVFDMDRLSGIYCSSDCVLDAFARGWPDYRGVIPEAELDE